MGLVAPAGRVRVDCHLHTVASGDAVLTLEQLAERARQTGLDVVCITDHNVTTAAVQATERDLGVRVVVGEEIRTPDGDVIGLFLTERIPYVLPLAEVIGRIRAQRGLVYVPHPFDLARSSLGRVLPGLCAEGAVDIIEVFNAKIRDGALNERAAELARAFGLPGGAGSDAHDAPGVGAAYLEMPDFDAPAGFLAALADAQLTGEFRDHAPRYPRRPVLPVPAALARSNFEQEARSVRDKRALIFRTDPGFDYISRRIALSLACVSAAASRTATERPPRRTSRS
jgi:predicted metal-dependent phosphoesterase TrpH